MIENSFIADQEYKQILLQIMDAIDKFCRENEINYYMIGGTLLGAVRHHGFIPWDDDIDIGIKRKDYKRFCESFNKNRTDNYRLICLDNTPDYYMSSAKVIDVTTSLYENCYQAIEIGVYIDVFPIDYIKDSNIDAAKALLLRTGLKDKMMTLKSMNISRDRALWKNILIIFGRLFCRGSMHSLSKNFEDRILQISGNENDEYIANLCGVWGEREISRTDNFSMAIELEFEGRKYLAPIGYDAYLKGVYGDYMQLPPEEKRVAHHDFVVTRKTNS